MWKLIQEEFLNLGHPSGLFLTLCTILLQICHNKSGEINPIKIGCLVEAYVKKYRYAAKKKALASAKPKP